MTVSNVVVPKAELLAWFYRAIYAHQDRCDKCGATTWHVEDRNQKMPIYMSTKNLGNTIAHCCLHCGGSFYFRFWKER